MSKKLAKEKILKSLMSLYSEDEAEWVYTNIERLVAKYQSKIIEEEEPLSEKDVILITYGDNVQQDGKSHLQTLKNFIDNYCLPEINTAHLLPCFPYTSDDGFSITDYYEIDPNLGSWNDMETLAKSSNLMYDAVVNHMSKSSQWFQSYLAGEDAYKNYFIAVDPKQDLSKVMRPRALPLLTPFKTNTGEERHIWTTFSEDQVDLNFKSPEVFIAILDVLLFYVSKGGKFIRLDAIAFLWKEIGTNCIHLPQTHTIIKLYKEVLRILTSNIYLITETNVPHKENVSYFGNGVDEADLVYNFSLAPLLVYSIMKGKVEKLFNWAQSLKLPSNKVCFFNFTASHDGIGMRPLQGIIPDEEIGLLAKRAENHGGMVGYKNNEDGTQSPYELNCNYMDLLSHPSEDNTTRIAKMMLTQSVMMAMPGIPGIYFHSLVGSQNYYEGVEKSGIKRRINREKLDFDILAKELSEKSSLRYHIFTSFKELLRIRTEQRAFNPLSKADYFKSDDSRIFVIRRMNKGETVYAIYNFSDETAEMDTLSQNVYDLINKKEVVGNTWKIEPFNFYWFKAN
ncbi:alpha-amylase family glycosyl hydrolase [uncultured Eudoraea sp.]|uniref:alpha-amylase family glycosyl hydrolase n=1 Tax=uncultured Eudoraea sp. TaxID=1035614 RepID=UPI00261C339B|nr:alpha-amylase family glycosyl hydrolase [uncultured Eudoraea sp.]